MSRKWVSEQYTTGPLYFEYLRDEGKIDLALFCFFMVGYKEQSYIDVGFIDETAMKDPEKLVYIDIPTYTEILFWFSRSTAIRFGETTEDGWGNPTAYTWDEYIPVIFDTGTSLTLIPNTVGGDIMARVLKGQRFSTFSGLY